MPEPIQTIQNVIVLLKIASSKHELSCEMGDDNTSFSYSYKYLHGFNHSIFKLDIYINPRLLWEKYQELPGKKKFDKDFTHDKKLMEGFIKGCCSQIIEHLKAFNHNADDYIEISKLVDKHHTWMLGEKTGI